MAITVNRELLSWFIPENSIVGFGGIKCES